MQGGGETRQVWKCKIIKKKDYYFGSEHYATIYSDFHSLHRTLINLCQYKWYIYLYIIAVLKHT